MKMVQKVLLTAVLGLLFSGAALAEKKQVIKQLDFTWNINVVSADKKIVRDIKLTPGGLYDNGSTVYLLSTNEWDCKYILESANRFESLAVICSAAKNREFMAVATILCSLDTKRSQYSRLQLYSKTEKNHVIQLSCK